MRRGTLITLIVLLLAMVVVAVIQIRLVTGERERLPGGPPPASPP